MKYGFIKVASAIPAVKVGDVIFNTQQIENQIAQAEGNCPSRDIPVRTSSASRCFWIHPSRQ